METGNSTNPALLETSGGHLLAKDAVELEIYLPEGMDSWLRPFEYINGDVQILQKTVKARIQRIYGNMASLQLDIESAGYITGRAFLPSHLT